MAENRPPTSVSDAQESADKDYEQRVRRYTISMIIRVVCLLLAFVVTGPLRWVMLGGAVVLPYIAVVIANSRNERLVHYDMSGVDGPPRPVSRPNRPAPIALALPTHGRRRTHGRRQTRPRSR